MKRKILMCQQYPARCSRVFIFTKDLENARTEGNFILYKLKYPENFKSISRKIKVVNKNLFCEPLAKKILVLKATYGNKGD